jgi:hypothetical protein
MEVVPTLRRSSRFGTPGVAKPNPAPTAMDTNINCVRKRSRNESLPSRPVAVIGAGDVESLRTEGPSAI